LLKEAARLSGVPRLGSVPVQLSHRDFLLPPANGGLAATESSKTTAIGEFRTLRTKLVARAQAGGTNTDEDVFETLKKK
jgi:hypothetical protein